MQHLPQVRVLVMVCQMVFLEVGKIGEDGGPAAVHMYACKHTI
jgi:hypothetical protein